MALVAVNTTSAIQWVELTNNQSTVLTITSLVASSGYALDPSTSCSTTSTVGANGYCMLAVESKPVAQGAQPGSITISTNAGNSPQAVTLSGTSIGRYQAFYNSIRPHSSLGACTPGQVYFNRLPIPLAA